MNQYTAENHSKGVVRVPRSLHAVTLMEAVIASFLLLSAFLVVVNLFHSGLGHMSRTENQQLAATLAERELERMRVWSETLNGAQYNYTSPGLATTYDGKSAVPPDFPGFSVATRVIAMGLYSSCTALELAIPSIPPLVQPRRLPGQASKVVVTVSWSSGQKSLKLVSLFSEPALKFNNPNPISITPAGPATLAHDGFVDFSASAADTNGQVIDGLLYSWAMVPNDTNEGAGTLTQARDGRTARLTNKIYGPPFNSSNNYQGIPCYTGGQCLLQVSARYHGQVVCANTPWVTLTP